MSTGDLFDDSNKFYRDAVDDPLKIIEPLGLSFFNNRDIDNMKRPNPHQNSQSERQPQKMQMTNRAQEGNQSNSAQQRKGALKKLAFVLSEKDKQLEKITYNRVSSVRPDMLFIEKIRFEQQKEQKQLLSDNEFKNATYLFDRQEYLNQYNKIVDQIKMEHYSNLKVIKCQNLLRMLTGFVKKNSQVSSYYHVFGSFENIGYIEYLKKDIELNMTTSILTVWLQHTNKQKNLKNSPRYSDVDIYVKETDEINIDSAESVRNYITTIKEQAQEQDISYEGLDLYLGLRTCSSAEGYFEQEKECQKRMIFDLTMICNLLAESQNCVIKFYNAFSTRTLMILYLFSKIFQTVVMSKPRTSSFSSNARYLHCTNFKQEIGRKLGETLLEKYEEFLQDNLPFELKLLTQDSKFSTNFIEKFLKTSIRLQIDFFESEEVQHRKYSDLVKQELTSIFSEPYYKDIVESFQIEDMKLKRDFGLKDMNLEEARKQIEKFSEEQAQQQEQKEEEINKNQKKSNLPQFSDDEEDEEDKQNNQSSIVNQFIIQQRKKDEEEKLRQEQKKDEKNLNNPPPAKKDPNVINQRVDRDLDFTKNLLKQFIPQYAFMPQKKK